MQTAPVRRAVMWPLSTGYWRAYDATMPWGCDAQDIEQLASSWARLLCGRGTTGLSSVQVREQMIHLVQGGGTLLLVFSAPAS